MHLILHCGNLGETRKWRSNTFIAHCFFNSVCHGGKSFLDRTINERSGTPKGLNFMICHRLGSNELHEDAREQVSASKPNLFWPPAASISAVFMTAYYCRASPGKLSHHHQGQPMADVDSNFAGTGPLAALTEAAHRRSPALSSLKPASWGGFLGMPTVPVPHLPELASRHEKQPVRAI